MGYILYSTLFLLLGISTILILTRTHWLPLLPSLPLSHLYTRLPPSSSSFANDIESGLTSSNFNLTPNLLSGDSRAGLDDGAKNEIQKIMRNKRVNFDEARRIYIEGRFARNGIGADGRPRDPKFVSFS